MKILVAIANFGTKNAIYIEKLLQEYRSMIQYEVHIAVLSNIPKDLGEDVEVIVGLPSKDPWSLPFAHKIFFARHIDDYDLFIYSEDDTLIRESNIIAFQKVNKLLPEDHIAGFLRYEEYQNGGRYYTTIHSHYHWDPKSIITVGQYTFAYFTNEHSACFLLTRDQLKKAIDSGGFLTEPRSSSYDMLCTAATDPYTQCGLRKVLCISHIEEFSLHHLPNVYRSKMGISRSMLNFQINRMLEIAKNKYTSDQLIKNPSKQTNTALKSFYYDKPNKNIISLLPENLESVLSVGCGWGATEEILIRKRVKVTGVPLDSVIEVCANSKGIETTVPNFDEALRSLSNRQFQCLLFNNILEFVSRPIDILMRYLSLLKPRGIVMVVTHNYNYVSVWKSKIYNGYNKYNFESSRAQKLDCKMISNALNDAGIMTVIKKSLPDSKYYMFSRYTLGLFDRLLSKNIYLIGLKE